MAIQLEERGRVTISVYPHWTDNPTRAWSATPLLYTQLVSAWVAGPAILSFEFRSKVGAYEA